MESIEFGENNMFDYKRYVGIIKIKERHLADLKEFIRINQNNRLSRVELEIAIQRRWRNYLSAQYSYANKFIVGKKIKVVSKEGKVNFCGLVLNIGLADIYDGGCCFVILLEEARDVKVFENDSIFIEEEV